MRTILIGLTVTLASTAGAQVDNQTRIPVPQGSPAFPTIGEVRCLEETGRGRYCAATWECGDDSGDLWSDMDDGPRTVAKESPLATRTNCAIVVDGEAAARWFTGYARGDVLAGVTANHMAEAPVVRRVAEGGDGDGNLFDYILDALDTTLPEIIDDTCGHIREGHSDHTHCVNRILEDALTVVQIQSNAATRCVFDVEWSTWEPTATDGPFWYVAHSHGADLYVHGGSGPLPDDRDESDDAYDHRQCFDHIQEVTNASGMEWYNASECDGAGRRCRWELRILE